MNEPLVCADVQPVDLRRLAAAVINQAMRDYFRPRRKSFTLQLDAALWLRSADASLYLETVDLGNVDIMRVLTARQAPKKLTQKKGTKPHARSV